MMQAGEHSFLANAVTGWQLVPMVVGGDAIRGGLQEART